MQILQVLEQNTVFFLTSIALLGLLVGSFLNVVIYRLPLMMQRSWRYECQTFLEQDIDSPKEAFNLSQPRSRCPSCQHLISAKENIPVFSYLFLKGRCMHCNASISIRYPIIEVITAALSVATACHFGINVQIIYALFFVWVLICLSLIDFDTQLLPDNITLPLLWLGLFASLFNVFVSPTDAIIGALAGYLSLWSVYWLFKILTGKEGMGHGDFKLLAAIGAFLGWQILPLVIMLSAFIGAVVGILLIVFKRHNKNLAIPFGPYLSFAALIALFYGLQINGWYLAFSGL